MLCYAKTRPGTPTDVASRSSAHSRAAVGMGIPWGFP